MSTGEGYGWQPVWGRPGLLLIFTPTVPASGAPRLRAPALGLGPGCQCSISFRSHSHGQGQERLSDSLVDNNHVDSPFLVAPQLGFPGSGEGGVRGSVFLISSPGCWCSQLSPHVQDWGTEKVQLAGLDPCSLSLNYCLKKECFPADEEKGWEMQMQPRKKKGVA